MRAIVTGASGFIGKRLSSALLDAGIEVIEIGQNPGDGGGNRIVFGPSPWPWRRWVEVLKETRPDAIFHLAGSRLDPPDKLREINFGLCEDMLRALRKTGQRPVVLVSGSAAEYGAALVDGQPVDEGYACKPSNLYGETKLAQTEAIMAFSKETGVRCVVARIFNPVGRGMPSNLSLGDFARQIEACASRNGELVTGDVDVERDFLPIEAVAGALVSLAFNPCAHGVVNICSGRPVKLRRLVEAMIARSGKEIRIRVDPARMRPGEPRVIVGSTKRLSSFGVSASPIDIEAVAEAMVTPVST
jgi:GDP-4-dehydro-6-deoxy-D-mannose reductase